MKPAAHLFAIVLIALCVAPLHAEDAKKKIVLVAGRDSHGRGEHEFRAGCILLAKALNENVPSVNAVCTFDGWPKDASIFDGAAAVVIYCDGGKGHPIIQHWSAVEEMIKKGVGIGCMHYGVEIPKGDGGGDRFLKWIGGYYEDGFSINPHWVCESILNKDHAIARGVNPFKAKDEWYFNIRFPEDKKGWASIVQGTPDDEARSGKTSWPRGPRKIITDASGQKESVMWAIERPDGGRGFGFTGGHFHNNWANDDIRKLVLNAIVWIAKVDVPEQGVPSKTPSPEEMEANLKAPKKK
ncbi:MAG TPA: ThuA domain-containing protein [Planctomycetota bacterium]|nr:ThuA domain-containing protein [Planctomycetota bacterium]